MGTLHGAASRVTALVAVAGMLTLQGCGSADSISSGAPSGGPLRDANVGFSGLEAPLTDEALSVRVPIIVVGLVTSKSIVRLADDPFLPPGWEGDEEQAKMVNGGAGNVKYAVSVTSTVKGTTATQIWAVRGANGEGVAADAAGPPSVGTDPEPGSTYQWWLEPYEWFGQEHYVLVRARLAA